MRTTVTGAICAVTIGIALLGQIPSAAQESSANPQTTLADTANDIRVETLRTRDQLSAAVSALDALTKQKSGDLRPAYEKFVTEVKQTHDAADRTVARAGDMETASKDYFGAWQTEIAAISNESLRTKSQRRYEDVHKSYGKVLASLRQAGAAFKPFLSDLDDVQRALANDVTLGGVNNVRSVANSANSNVKTVLRHVNEAIDELGRMETALSSQKGA